jgi:phosphoglycolate phosphatase
MFCTVIEGQGKGAYFVEGSKKELEPIVGFTPFHGTLNLRNVDTRGLRSENIEELGEGECKGVAVHLCRINGIVAGTTVPIIEGYSENIVEIIAPVELRKLFGLRESDEVVFSPREGVWESNGALVKCESINLFESVIFDLDQTLVHLDVDWRSSYEELEVLMQDHIEGEITDYRHEDIFQISEEKGLFEEVNDILTKYEIEGAKNASPLKLVGLLDKLSIPISVCTINSPEAAKIALKKLGVVDKIECIIGRDSAVTKPDPEPLYRCLNHMETSRGNSIFIGDARSDAEAAYRAQMSYLHPDQVQ